jgi:hypothetical protein
VRDLKEARETGTGYFPSFDHHHGDPIEDTIQVGKGGGRAGGSGEGYAW